PDLRGGIAEHARHERGVPRGRRWLEPRALLAETALRPVTLLGAALLGAAKALLSAVALLAAGITLLAGGVALLRAAVALLLPVTLRSALSLLRLRRGRTLEAEHGAVLGVPEVHHARAGDLLPGDLLGANEHAVAAAHVLQDPDRPFRADRRVVPRRPLVREGELRRGIPPDPVHLANGTLQPLNVTHRAYKQRRCGLRTLRHLIPHRLIPPAQYRVDNRFISS